MLSIQHTHNIKCKDLHTRYSFHVHSNFWSCRRKRARAFDDIINVTVEEDCVMVRMSQDRTHKLNNRLCCTALKYL